MSRMTISGIESKTERGREIEEEKSDREKELKSKKKTDDR